MTQYRTADGQTFTEEEREQSFTHNCLIALTTVVLSSGANRTHTARQTEAQTVGRRGNERKEDKSNIKRRSDRYTHTAL